MKNQEKKHLGELTNTHYYPNWVKGFLIKGDRKYHPYTKIGFKFDCR